MNVYLHFNFFTLKYFLITLLFLVTQFAYAQQGIIDQAQELVDHKKYESAFNLLQENDPGNTNPDIVVKKTRILLDYFVTSIMHQMFALTDLKDDENLMDIRGSEGDYSIFLFAPDSIIPKLMEQYPKNYDLSKIMGYYYHEVHGKYGGNWLVPDSVIVDRFMNYYKTAYNNGVYDYWSSYGLGYGCLMQNQAEKSIQYFVKSIELRADYPSSHYNLAYAYMSINEKSKAIESADKAFELYEEPRFKADAARMIAQLYRELDDQNSALSYFRKANIIDPNNYYTLKPLLTVELALNDDKYPERTKEFLDHAPGNPTIYQNLMEIYWANGKEEELVLFLESQKKRFTDNMKVLGNLYFYIGVIRFDQEKYKEAEKSFLEAKTTFNKIYKDDHGVFKAIDSFLKDSKKL